jgi:8-oxo-dGTP pyrophosphatase MutT (NUDIX family)
MRAVQNFEVSLKAFVLNETGHALLVREADTGFWELPGGRIDVGEEAIAHVDVLRRELAEELGAAFQVEMTDRIETWTRRRPTDGVFQLVVARLCTAPRGDIRLSAEHDAFAWLEAPSIATLTLPPHSGYHDGLTRLFACAARL